MGGEIPSPLPHMRTQWEDATYEPGGGPSPELNHAGNLVLDFPAYRIVGNEYLLFMSHPFCLILLAAPVD